MLESDSVRFAGRRDRPTRRMRTVQDRQHRGRGRLHTQRHPGVAGRANTGEELGRGGLRVGLRGDLRLGGQCKTIPDSVEHGRQTPGAQQRGCSSADEDRVDVDPTYPISGQFQFGPQCGQPAVGRGIPQLAGGIGVEIAVTTAGGTKRYVHVDAEGAARRDRQARKVSGGRRRGTNRHAARHAAQCGRTPLPLTASATLGRLRPAAFLVAELTP